MTTANKATELSDFSVCTSWGIAGKDLYLLHVLRKRMEYPELKRAVCLQAEAFNASVVLIEDKASGTQLIQELVELGLHAVTRYQPQSDKVMRMHTQTAMIENGFLHLPKEAGWLPEYLYELSVFPNGKHDDRVDSTSQLARPAQAGRPRAPRHLPVLQGARPGAADRPARAIIGDGEAAGPPPLVTGGRNIARGSRSAARRRLSRLRGQSAQSSCDWPSNTRTCCRRRVAIQVQ